MSQTNPVNIVVERENSSNHQNFIKYKLMKEIVFQLKQKECFALGFENDRGGWELRNKYQKLATSPKTFTYHKNNSDK